MTRHNGRGAKGNLYPIRGSKASRTDAEVEPLADTIAWSALDLTRKVREEQSHFEGKQEEIDNRLNVMQDLYIQLSESNQHMQTEMREFRVNIQENMNQFRQDLTDRMDDKIATITTEIKTQEENRKKNFWTLMIAIVANIVVVVAAILGSFIGILPDIITNLIPN